MRKNKAFTLIELLVVMSIIALLASVVLASLGVVRSRARDARRLSDIRQIQTALESYYSDYGRYPSSQLGCGATIPNNSWCNSIESYSGGHWIANGALAPYLSKDPVDPKPHTVATFDAVNNASGGSYFYFSWLGSGDGCAAGQSYTFIAGMEIVSNRKNTLRHCDGTGYASGGTYIVGSSVY